MYGIRPENVPTGWPVKCVGCESWSFYYISDRSGNFRLYNCKSCKRRYIAKWKGRPITSVFSEPKNTKMQDWLWVEVCEGDEGAIDVDFEIVTDECCDGTEAMRLPVRCQDGSS
jgi:hypothetical protein